MVDGVPHLLSTRAGELLGRLAGVFECVWCTGWEDRAEEHLPGLLGLPGGWPHLVFTEPPDAQAHWKLAAIGAYAGSHRAVAWIDDAHDDTCRRWAAMRSGPTLLVATDPAVGLTEEHVEDLLSWSSAVAR
ncbi:MAG: hypothetical protein M3O90_09490 [Actinomycetota bacterium]|nr:hypothetical protein [Actinomycetota bacterium]